ncbi:MAG: hypothetical protein CMG64_06570 [Candidatus Marinimicrobia bacterium]|nr:hypothetical protein [Candidatus Neomarinimicrobiota bacterium]
MKNLLIIYNIIFLFVGNTLFSSIHYLHHHDHDHNHGFEIHECEECIIIQDSNDYILEYEQVNFSNNNTGLFVFKYISILEFDFPKNCLSRAPPTSK